MPIPILSDIGHHLARYPLAPSEVVHCDLSDGRIQERHIGQSDEARSGSVLQECLVSLPSDQGPTGGIGDHDTKHEIVNHSAKEYVRGDIHTNSIENFWSLLKRSVTGTYHKLSIKHLDAYLDELEWRFNNRDNPYLFRDTLIKLLQSENLEYRELVAS